MWVEIAVGATRPLPRGADGLLEVASHRSPKKVSALLAPASRPSATRLWEARDIEGGVVDYHRGLGINQVGWRDQFFVRPPGANERAFFNLSDRVQVAMLDVQRTGYDEEGNPIRVTVTVYPGDRNEFEMEAGKVPPPPSAPKS